MSEGQAAAPATGGTSTSRSSLRTCLLVGAGCLAVLGVGLCLTVVLAFPRLRDIYEGIRAGEGLEDLIDLTTQELPFKTLEAVQIASPTAAPDLCGEGICLSFPPGAGFAALPETKAEQLEPDVWAEPEHLEFRLTRYPLEDTFHAPRISVYDIERFRQVNPNVGSMLDELAALLQSRPQAPESIPLIPIFNAAQMILADVAYLEFEGGSGVRFVTQYGQAVWPINNHDLFYAFCGLSSDGRTLVSAILPITNQGLPDDPEGVIGDDMDAFADGFTAYIEATQAMLDAAAPGSFTPGLYQLDALMRSIQLQPAP